MRKTTVSFRIRLVAVLFATIAVVVAASATRLSYKYYVIGQEIGKVNKEIAELTKEKQNLEQSLASFDDAGVLERQAREKLNLQKEGEHVVILLPSGETQMKQDESTQKPPRAHEPSNPVKWWRYFFGR